MLSSWNKDVIIIIIIITSEGSDQTRVLSVQYYCIPFMQRKRDIILKME